VFSDVQSKSPVFQFVPTAFTRLLQNAHVSLVLRSPEQYSRRGLTRAEHRGRITSLDLLATLLLMQPRLPLTFFFPARAHS